MAGRDTLAFLDGGGQMGARMRDHDWSGSPLGPPALWPQSLRSVAGLMLASKFGTFLAWGPDLVFLYNDAYAEIIGGRHPDALGRPFRDSWPEIWPEISPLVEAALQGRTAFFEDMPLVMNRQGYDEQAWFTFSYSPIRDDSGAVAGLFCTTCESTGKVMNQRRIVAERAQLGHLFEQSPTFMAMLKGPEHRFELLNPGYAKLIGHRDVLGKTVAEALPDAVAQGYLDLLDSVFKSGKPYAANGMRYAAQVSPDGPVDERFVDVVFQPMVDAAGAVTGIFVEGADVTQRTLADAALRDSEARLRDLNETLEQRMREREMALRDSIDFARLALSAVNGVGVWTYDVAGDRFFCDAAISELYGLDPAQAAAGIPRAEFLVNLHPDDRAPLAATMQGGLVRPGDLELEYRIRHPDGSTRWVLSRGHTYFDRDGTPLRRTGVGIDMSRQRQLEEQLRQSQKLEAVGQLTGGVAHDFNNMLTVIRSSVDLLKRPNLTEDRRQRYIDAISETTARAAKLTGQLLAFARRQALKPEVFNVVDSVQAVGDMLVTIVGARIRIDIQVPAEACLVNADASQFDNALVNLAVNARDAMQGEGTLTISVTVASRIPPLRAHPAQEGSYVVVSMRDTGSGIAPDDLDRIFEPFFTTKGVGHGTGLGLSQVFGFAKQSGGEITVNSEAGRGATFSLYLPRVSGASPTTAIDHQQTPVDGHGTRVLVVEDNADVGSFATQTLQELGYDPILAHDAESALAALQQNAEAIDVVFSDVVMPGMNGLELAERIRDLHPDLPVVLTSGYSHVLALNDAHGFELLHKPYSIEQLSRLLQKTAHWRRLRRILES